MSAINKTQFDIVFISMPFASLKYPSLGLSILKGILKEYQVKINYFTFSFASVCGTEFYDFVANSDPTKLIGEWLFAKELFPEFELSDLEWYANLGRSLDDCPAKYKSLNELKKIQELVPKFLLSCFHEIEALDPKVVGFTSTFQQNCASLSLAKIIKKYHPDKKIIFGGANCFDVMGKAIAQLFPFVDIVCTDEGENVILPLVKKILTGKSFAHLKGIIANGNTGSGQFILGELNKSFSMNDIPYSDFSDYFSQLSKSNLPELQKPELLFEMSRGCWWGEKHHCKFCGLNSNEMSYRSKSTQHALAEVDVLIKKYPGYDIFLTDNILSISHLNNFFPEIANRKYPVHWFVEIKANIPRRQLEILANAKVLALQPGVESLSDKILTLMDKGITMLSNLLLLKNCLELGIDARWNFLYGFPLEDTVEYQKMEKIIKYLHHLPPPIGSGSVRLDRFSPYFEQSQSFGITNVKPVKAYNFIYPIPESELNDLAYHFDADIPFTKPLKDYVNPVLTAINIWKYQHSSSMLVRLKLKRLDAIFDSRFNSSGEFYRLNELESTLFDLCCEINTISSIIDELMTLNGKDAPTVFEAISTLEGKGFLLTDNGKILSLVTQPKSKKIIARISQLFENIVRPH